MELFLDILFSILVVVYSWVTVSSTINKNVPKWLRVVTLITGIGYPLCFIYLAFSA